MFRTAAKLAATAAALIMLIPTTAAGSTAGVSVASCNGDVVLPPGYTTYVWMPAVNGNVNCLMSQGAAGRPVYPLQYALIYCHGLNTGGYDGQYGRSTREAVVAVQRANGIPADGVYGPQTKAVIRWPVFQSFTWTGQCGRVNW